MKTWLMAMLLISATGAFAQQNAPKEPEVKRSRWDADSKADKMSDKLYKELNLTKKQHQEIYNINADISRRRELLKRDSSQSARNRMLARQQLDSERSHRFKSVLTPVQYKKWNDWELKKKENLEAKMDRKQDKRQARKANR